MLRPGHAVIEVKAAGICGIDLEIFQSTMFYFTAGMAKWSVILGHEWSAEVLAEIRAAVDIMECSIDDADAYIQYYIAFSGFMGGAIGRMLIRRYNFFARSVMRQAFGDKRKLTPAAHEHYLRALPTAEDRKGCYVFRRQIVKSTPWLDQIWSNIAVLKSKPTLIVWGMKDIAFREKELKRWEATFPKAQSVRLSSVGHFVQEEAPDELAAAVVPFLQESSASSRVSPRFPVQS